MTQNKDEILLRNTASVLKKLRIAKSFTQADVYTETGIHIGRIESLKANLTIDTLSKICTYFDISLSDFFKQVEKI